MSTHTPIATQTLASAASSVTFSSIPQGYTDLVLIANRLSSSLDNLSMQFNGDTGSNYSFTVLYGTGSTAGSARSSNTNNPYLDYYAASESTFAAPVILNIQNYANSTTYKTTLARGSNASRGVDATVMLWRSTSAITSILLKCHDGSNFTSGSTFSLYGIAVGNSSAKADGGSSVVTDGTYWYHTFKSSGVFVPKQSLTADILVVAGGGGAGGTYGNGGGGAGGLVYTASQSLSTASYAVLVGAGGVGNLGLNGATAAVKGSNSNMVGGSLSLTAAVGGGGSAGGTSITNGGSGAGGTYSEGTNSWYTGSGTSGQGNNGGQGTTVGGDKSLGGGGGGASAAGSAASNPNAGAGGAGSSTYSSWGSATKTGQLSSGTYYYAGGGGGGTDSRISSNAPGAGGLGGGGAGGTSGGAGTAGLTSTGGGGGGGGYNSGGPGTAGGNGGSGVVIIRYAV